MALTLIRLPLALAFAILGALAIGAGLAAAMPTITVTSPANATLTNVSSLVFEANVNPPNASVTFDGNPVFPNASGNISELAMLSEGLNALTITARDWLNETASVTVFVLLDTVPPNLTITAPANGTLTNQPWVQVWGTVQPRESSVEIRGNQAATDFGGNFSFFVSLDEGPNLVLVNATDPAGNTARASLNLTLDTVPPAVTVDAPANGTLTNRTNVTLLGHAEIGSRVTVNGYPATLDGAGNFTLDLALDALFDQTVNIFVVRAVDAAGNVAYANMSVIVDVLAPSINLDLDPDTRSQLEAGMPLSITSILLRGTTDSVDANLTIANTSVPLAGLSFSITVALSEGLNNISIRVQDAAGNSREFTLAVIRDTVPPALTLTSPPAPNFLTNASQLDVEGSVNEGGAALFIAYTDMRGLPQVDAIPTTLNTTSSRLEFSYLLPLNADGYPHSVTVRAQDAAGNTAESTFTYTCKFGTPFLEVLPVPRLTWQTFVWINGTTEPGIDNVTINGEVFEVVGQFFAVRWDLPDADGNYTFSVRIQDGAGNSRVEEVTTRLFRPPLPASTDLLVDGTPALEVPAGAAVSLSLNYTPVYPYSVVWSVDFEVAAVGNNLSFTFSEGPHTVVAYLSTERVNATYAFEVMARAPPQPLPGTLTLALDGRPDLLAEAGSSVRLALNLTNASSYNVTWTLDGEYAGAGPAITLVVPEGAHTVVATVSNGAERQNYTFAVQGLRTHGDPPAPSSSLPVLVVVSAAAAAAALGIVALRRRRG